MYFVSQQIILVFFLPTKFHNSEKSRLIFKIIQGRGNVLFWDRGPLIHHNGVLKQASQITQLIQTIEQIELCHIKDQYSSILQAAKTTALGLTCSQWYVEHKNGGHSKMTSSHMVRNTKLLSMYDFMYSQRLLLKKHHMFEKSSRVEESRSHNVGKRQQTAGWEVRSDYKWSQRGVLGQKHAD